MADFEHNNIAVKGLSVCVPKTIVKTVSFSRRFGKNVIESFIDKTGVIETHRSLEKQTASDLCYIAAKQLIEKKELEKNEIGLLIFVSQTPDYVSPATAHVLHERLGLNKDCMVFDVNLGCSGWVYGINICASIMESSNIDKAILCFGDTVCKTISPYDQAQIMLMGEGGCATLLEKEKGKTISGICKSDGSGFKSLIIPAGGFRNKKESRKRVLWGKDGYVRSKFDSYMNGIDVFSFTISCIPKMILNYLNLKKLTFDMFDSIVLHQANLFILQTIMKRIKVLEGKCPISLDRYGNTSGVSIPLTICDKYGNDNKEEEIRILGCGFGVGLSYGLVDFFINKRDILPIIESDEYYIGGVISSD